MKERKKSWDEKVEIVKNSYNRSKKNALFAHTFYENLFFLKPKIKNYFSQTDFKHQEKAIMMGMDYLIGFLEKDSQHARQQILRLSRSHSVHGMKIHPHDYYYWTEALVMTIEKYDHLWQKDFVYYWRECISFPITFIISQYFVKED